MEVNVKVLMIGDVVSQVGCNFVREVLPRLKQENDVNIVIANGENSAVGNGILPTSANFLLDSGVDIITTGNHVFKRYEIQTFLDETPQVVRPANYPSIANGNGYYIYDGGSFNLCVINMMGTSFMEPLACPFETIDRLLEQDDIKGCKYILVDFHAESTGEKKAFGYYLDGRVSAVAGTHTHVQTADEQILPLKTGYITDLGMTGPYQSVLGVCPQNVIARLKTHLPTRFEVMKTDCSLNAILLDLCEKSGKCLSISRINIK